MPNPPTTLLGAVDVTIFHEDGAVAETTHSVQHEIGFGDTVEARIHGARLMLVPEEITEHPLDVHGLQIWRTPKMLVISKPRNADKVKDRSAMFWFDFLTGAHVRVKRLEAAERACADARPGQVDSACSRSLCLDLSAATHISTQLFWLVSGRDATALL